MNDAEDVENCHIMHNQTNHLENIVLKILGAAILENAHFWIGASDISDHHYKYSDNNMDALFAHV